MARYYRRRYTRVVKPKKKWASNIKTFDGSPINVVAGGVGAEVLVQNSAQSSNPTPSVIKTGNFKVSIDSTVQFTTSESMNPVFQFFIVYVPEGWQTSQYGSLISSHPEWIMASKTVGGSYTTGTTLSLETVNFSSRLKRNLNSGDGIVMVVVPSILQDVVVRFTGHVRYWTCAN